jgi:hypothetical protein
MADDPKEMNGYHLFDEELSEEEKDFYEGDSGDEDDERTYH